MPRQKTRPASYADIEALPEYSRSPAAQKLVASRAFQARLAKLRAAELVDYEGVAAAKREVLEIVFRKPGKTELPTRGLREYAVFEALREKRHRGRAPGLDRQVVDQGSHSQIVHRAAANLRFHHADTRSAARDCARSANQGASR